MQPLANCCMISCIRSATKKFVVLATEISTVQTSFVAPQQLMHQNKFVKKLTQLKCHRFNSHCQREDIFGGGSVNNLQQDSFSLQTCCDPSEPVKFNPPKLLFYDKYIHIYTHFVKSLFKLNYLFTNYENKFFIFINTTIYENKTIKKKS